MKQKFQTHEENVQSIVLNKIDLINAKRETNNLRKQEQQENFENLKRQHEDKMLKLQMKHLGTDVKNKLNKYTLHNQHQKNL